MTTLCGQELSEAAKGGYVESVHEWCEFTMGSPLASFERACWSMRCEADQAGLPAVSTLAKALAVSVIGKLHAYSEQWEEVEADYNDPICGHWLGPDGKGGSTEYRAVAGQVSRKRRTGLSGTAIPAIPLWIWSASRSWLWERMHYAGLDEVIYADTDGLIVSPRGWDRLCGGGYITEGDWGELRYVAGPCEVEVLGPKMVRIGETLIQAGAPKNQRGSQFVEAGYWFRRPVNGGGNCWQESAWEEVQREKAT